jgi:iron complex transport system ATP-binding protein
MLRLRDIRVTRNDNALLDGVDLSVAPGALLGIVGPNGAGKSTLLRVMAGVLEPDGGTVALDGREMGAWPARARAQRVAYLPQHPACHPAMTVERVVALGRLPHLAAWQGPGAVDREAIARAMADTDVAQLAARRAGSLSGGEHARVMLARALAADTPLLLADEPVADLDPYHALEVMDRLARLARAGRTVVVVLHDLTLAARFCARIALMARGRIVAAGPPADTLSPENLAAVYRIAALRGEDAGEAFLLPWSRLPADREAPP